MKKMGLKNNLNLKIDNFGPIESAEFDIKPFTIFTGPNNSGKSYSVMLIHCLTHYLRGQKDLGSEFFWTDLTTKSLEKLINSIFEENKSSSESFKTIQNIRKFIERKPSKNEKLEIEQDSIDLIIREGIGKFYIELLQKKIESEFKSNLNDLISYGSNSFKISENDDFEMEYVEKSIKIIKFPKANIKRLEMIYYPHIHFKVSENKILLSLDYKSLNKEYENDSGILVLILLSIYNLVGTPILKDLLKNESYYMPAARSEAMQDIRETSQRGKDSGISEFVKYLGESINGTKSEDTEFCELTEKFESEIIGGNIIFLEPAEGFSELFYENEEFKIPITLASASISELTPIFMYLKKIVKKGDTLIIEEPEAHLHPKNQRILVKYLSRLMKMGLNIIITTHSDYILEQVNNLILLSRVSEGDRIDKFGYEVDDYLEKEDVSVYLFVESGLSKFKTKSIEIGDLGISESSFTPIIDELYGESHNIKKYLFT